MVKKTIADYTEKEFLELVKGIYNNSYPSEQTHMAALLSFERLSEHPAGSDLLYFPEKGQQGSEAVVKVIKAWRAEQGKPGFKSG